MKLEKNIGLIIADENEIHEHEEFTFVKSINNNAFRVRHYKLDNLNIFMINSGIGIVNASIATQHLIDNFSIDSIWNYGAVGATNKLKLYDVVIPKRFYYVDVETPWYKFGQIPQEDEYFINDLRTEIEIYLGTSQSFIDTNDKIDKIKNNIDVDLFDMESCAIANVCKKNGLKFFSIKCISDIIGNTNVEKNNINNSITIAAKKALEEMIKKLKIYKK